MAAGVDVFRQPVSEHILQIRAFSFCIGRPIRRDHALIPQSRIIGPRGQRLGDGLKVETVQILRRRAEGVRNAGGLVVPGAEIRIAVVADEAEAAARDVVPGLHGPLILRGPLVIHAGDVGACIAGHLLSGREVQPVLVKGELHQRAGSAGGVGIGIQYAPAHVFSAFRHHERRGAQRFRLFFRNVAPGIGDRRGFTGLRGFTARSRLGCRRFHRRGLLSARRERQRQDQYGKDKCSFHMILTLSL